MKVVESKTISAFGGLNFVLEEFDELNLGSTLTSELPNRKLQVIEPHTSPYSTTQHRSPQPSCHNMRILGTNARPTRFWRKHFACARAAVGDVHAGY